ncbi:ABA4-like family protein [Algoriphagus mannitolivorans]|uniref:ABA4-like family protein n=1 Tax=Algoriphagus mannitolivorans TaxID=226504 RepID=UPI0004045CD9|nr:ABA4-like family protein [Algoriphagus mannitolivorans]
MDLETVFSIANSLAFFCWILLFVLYQKKWVYKFLYSFVFGILSLAYLFFILKGIGSESQGGFDSLANVKTMFSSDEAVLAGWIHYLAFDLFVGMWICHDSGLRNINRWILLPCLLLTFLMGPIGFLLYLLVRIGYEKSYPQNPFFEKSVS